MSELQAQLDAQTFLVAQRSVRFQSPGKLASGQAVQLAALEKWVDGWFADHTPDLDADVQNQVLSRAVVLPPLGGMPDLQRAFEEFQAECDTPARLKEQYVSGELSLEQFEWRLERCRWEEEPQKPWLDRPPPPRAVRLLVPLAVAIFVIVAIWLLSFLF